MYVPFSLEIVVAVRFVTLFVKVMVTPGKTAPLASLTVPLIAPVFSCAIAGTATSKRLRNSRSPLDRKTPLNSETSANFMVSPCWKWLSEVFPEQLQRRGNRVGWYASIYSILNYNDRS